MENIKNTILNNFDKVDIVFYFLLLLAVINFIILFANSSKTKKKISSIPSVAEDKTVKDTLSELNDRINDLEQYKNASANQIHKITEALADLNRIETKKYNPFADAGVGGMQSFSTAIINQKGDGIILTSLYSRSSTRVSLKEVNSWQTTQELSPEEKEVLEKAKS